MISSLVVDAAVRSAILAAAVWIALRVFRVRNVPAEKAAWGLVLGAALLMPVVLPMTAHWSVLPANVRVVIPADPQNLLEELRARIQATPAAEHEPAAIAAPGIGDAAPAESSVETGGATAGQALTAQPALQADADAGVERQSAVERDVAPAITHSSEVSAERNPSARVSMWRRLSLLQLAGIVYLAIAGALFVRLFYGVLVALHVWRSAKPVVPEPTPFADGIRLRASDSISTPVTIGSAVVLPDDYREWDQEKLRVVLAHERSHVRQGDFYLQLLAGVYCAVVWFSPLGWWLKRKLSDLAETISDRAGMEEAADRTSYAQILLEFAAAPRPTLIGVAMARSGSISRRIERLLNDVTFRQAFAGTRRALVAVVVIPVALFAATALVRVEAAGQQTVQPVPPTAPTGSPQAPVPAAAPAPAIEGVPTPEPISSEQAPQAPDVAPVAPAPPTHGSAPDTASLAPPAAPQTPSTAPAAPAAPQVVHVPPVNVHVPAKDIHIPAINMHVPARDLHVPAVNLNMPARNIHVPAINMHVPARDIHVPAVDVHVAQMNLQREMRMAFAYAQESHSGIGYRNSSNGDSYAVVHGNNTAHMTFSGNWMEGRRAEIEKARKQAGGNDFLWFTHDGKAYLVDDPATVAQIEAMYKPMEELGRQQEELGKKQEALGKQQEELGRQQQAVSVPTPDMSKQIAEIDAAMAKLKASQGKNVSQEQFADLQEKLGELQGKLGEIQGEIGSKQGEFGARMGELGAKMGALGAQQGELGARQGKLAEQADQKVKSIIDASLKNGKAKPVQ